MSEAIARLPAGFEALEPFAAVWSARCAAGRAQLRDGSSESDRAAFYQAAKDLLPVALAYLDKKPIAEFDEKEERLMNVLLSLAHVALAVETQAADEAKHAEARRNLRITRASADQSAS